MALAFEAMVFKCLVHKVSVLAAEPPAFTDGLQRVPVVQLTDQSLSDLDITERGTFEDDPVLREVVDVVLEIRTNDLARKLFSLIT